MLSFIRSHRSALVCLAGLATLAILLLLAVVGLFLAAFPAEAQNLGKPWILEGSRAPRSRASVVGTNRRLQLLSRSVDERRHR